MRRTAATLALVVSPLFLAACGDKKTTDDATSAKPAASSKAATEQTTPTTTAGNKSDFCAAEKMVVDAQMDAFSGGKADVDKLKAAYAKLDDAGLPSGAPADVKKGYEIAMDQADKIDWDAMAKDPSGYATKMSKDLSKDDLAAGTAFGSWVVKTCKITVG